MYKNFDSSMNFSSREKDILEFWQKNKIFQKSVSNREGKKQFTFYEGPPTANGKPHIGHILTRVIKDIIPRHRTMKGYFVPRIAGWDTHGLPVELEVEKKLGFDGKADIEKYGVSKFIKECKESVFKYQKEWETVSKRIGYWVDLENPYITYKDEYIESVWWALKEIFSKGLIYKGHKVVPFCPRCQTALSSHEVGQGYKTVSDPSVIVAFRLEDEASGSDFRAAHTNFEILVWTTTPWTLPSNVALCVNPKADYAFIECEGRNFVLAKQLLEKHFTNKQYRIIKIEKGSSLVDKKYQPLYKMGGEYKIVADEFVSLSDGTGVVHIAPCYGEEDAKVARTNSLPFVQMVGTDGKFKEGISFTGQFCKDADKSIIKDLKERKLIFYSGQISHSYPFCWRCHKPLIYFARESWFIEVTRVKKNLIKNLNKINWLPDNVRTGRMGNFLETVVDWGISRERYWGTPLPLWVCRQCKKIEAIGSKEELIKRGNIKGEIELHKPFVDEVKLECSCGGIMERTPEVLDCWFDSGAMPFAACGYPQKNQEKFFSSFPADFISEAVDQTRGWFYTLLAISTLLFNKPSFKNCIVLGHVNDKNGIKMSKHIGNVVDPIPIIEEFGADAVRWYFYTSSAPYLPSRFYKEAVSESQRKFLGTLWNTVSFYALYAGIDNFNPSKHSLKPGQLTIMDKWILSELNSLILFVDDALNSYKIIEAARKIEQFVDALSNWFVRVSRERFWASGMEDDKIAAYTTLYTVLSTLSGIIAPFVPFVAESIYRSLVLPFYKLKPSSVHLCNYPKANKNLINLELQENMHTTLQAATLGRAARNSVNIKNRQPLSFLYLTGKELQDSFINILKAELNVKNVKFIKNASEFVIYKIKPQLKTLGPKYTKNIGAIREYLLRNGKEVVSDIEKNSSHSFMVNGEEVSVSREDILVEVESKAGFVSAAEGGVAVILDTFLTKELILEGIAREIISKVQSMRKENDFSVTDKINIYFSTKSSQIEEAIEKNKQKICSITLCEEISKDNRASTVLEISGEEILLSVERVKK